MTSDSKAPVTDEQRAREWLALQGIMGWAEGAKDYAISDLAALLARRALEEAKWWKLQIESRIHGINFYQHMNFDVADKIELERIAELEQAAASKTAGGGHE